MAKKYQQIIVCEDEQVSNLYPLTLTRPAWDLICGTGTLLDRIRRKFPEADIGVWVRDYIADHVSERFPDVAVNQAPRKSGILINARLTDLTVLSDLPDPGEALFHSGIAMAATFQAKQIAPWFKSGGTAAVLDGFKKGGELPDSCVIEYPWHMTVNNEGCLINDIRSIFGQLDRFGEVDPSTVVGGEENLSMGVGTTVAPFAVIDATTGPVVMGKNVTIESHSLIQGPLFVDDNSVIRSHARIYGNVSIGAVSKLGGEIHSSIVHGFTNKQHDGFLGNSVVGSWCNLGAGTTVSNLKNNYKMVKVQIGDRVVDTNGLFVGSILGDHSATAIGTILNTGTVVGVGCNLFGAGFPPRYIPSFHWGGNESLERQPFDKAVAAMKAMMARRDHMVSDVYRVVLKHVYETTERDHALKTS
jgi:UDP-N-acetylglucosamine diphosphorylase/glucosamine-1-phosphate N-acetyltransferase